MFDTHALLHEIAMPGDIRSVPEYAAERPGDQDNVQNGPARISAAKRGTGICAVVPTGTVGALLATSWRLFHQAKGLFPFKGYIFFQWELSFYCLWLSYP